ncbi:MAG TPA: hypothetical protein VIK78_16680 [Ruminiclostridium sp.]
MNIETKLRNKSLNKSTYTKNIFDIFLCFLIYSFLGWVIETIYISIYYGHLTKRGFLLEPLTCVSRILLQGVEHIENVTSKVVYYIRH